MIQRCNTSIHVLSFLALMLIIILMLAGCEAKTNLDDDVTAGPEAIADGTENINENILEGNGSSAENEWLAAIGEWEDQDGRGYEMRVSANEAKTDILFSVSFTPHGGTFLDWVLPCELLTAADSETLYYNNGLMTYLEMVPDDTGNVIPDSYVEKNIAGNFSFDANQDILCWYNSSEDASDPIYFVRSQQTEGELTETMINGIPYTIADANGWGGAWQTIAENIREGTDIYFKEAEDDPSLYGTDSAWEGITIEGITYEMAAKHGWGDAWMEAANHMGTAAGVDDNPSEYEEPFEQGDDYTSELSDAKLIEINNSASVRISNEWKNNYNKNLTQSQRITSIHVRNILPYIERNDSAALVVTEVEYWLAGKGGSASGSVCAVVMIDIYSGDILTAAITS